MQSGSKPPLLILGAPPRGGNHLLRGLLDNHPQLLLPPGEDYCVRELARHPLLRWRGMLVSRSRAPEFFRQLQKGDHLERVNAGQGAQVFGTEDSLNLTAYYRYISKQHRRGRVDNLVRSHVEALAAALGQREGDGRLRVVFCALQARHRDLSRVSRLLARSYAIRGVFLVRDPRAHLSSKLVRNPTLDLGRFCERQNLYWQEINEFAANCGPALRLRFEDLVTDTESRMREVCDFAGIEFAPGVLEYTQGGAISRSNSSFTASTGIDTAVLTRYRETLPAETIAYLEQHCLPELFWPGAEESADDGGAAAL